MPGPRGPSFGTSRTLDNALRPSGERSLPVLPELPVAALPPRLTTIRYHRLPGSWARWTQHGPGFRRPPMSASSSARRRPRPTGISRPCQSMSGRSSLDRGQADRSRLRRGLGSEEGREGLRQRPRARRRCQRWPRSVDLRGRTATRRGGHLSGARVGLRIQASFKRLPTLQRSADMCPAAGDQGDAAPRGRPSFWDRSSRADEGTPSSSDCPCVRSAH